MNGAKGDCCEGDIELLGDIDGELPVNILLLAFCNTGDGVPNGEGSGDFLADDTLQNQLNYRCLESHGSGIP